MDHIQLGQLKAINWIAICCLIGFGIGLFFTKPEEAIKDAGTLNESSFKKDTKIYSLFTNDEEHEEGATLLLITSVWTFISVTIGAFGLIFEKAYTMYLFTFSLSLLLVILPITEIHVILVKLNIEERLYSTMINTVKNISIDESGAITGDYANVWNFIQKRYECCGRADRENIPPYNDINSTDVVWAFAQNNRDDLLKTVSKDDKATGGGPKFLKLLEDFNKTLALINRTQHMLKRTRSQWSEDLRVLSETRLEEKFNASLLLRAKAQEVMNKIAKVLARAEGMINNVTVILTESWHLFPEVGDLMKKYYSIVQGSRQHIGQLIGFARSLEDVSKVWAVAHKNLEGRQMANVNRTIERLNKTYTNIERRAALFSGVLDVLDKRGQVLLNVNHVDDYGVPASCCDLSYEVAVEDCFRYRTFYKEGCFLVSVQELKNLIRSFTQILSYEAFVALLAAVMSLQCGRTIEDKQELLAILRHISSELHRERSVRPSEAQ